MSHPAWLATIFSPGVGHVLGLHLLHLVILVVDGWQEATCMFPGLYRYMLRFIPGATVGMKYRDVLP